MANRTATTLLDPASADNRTYRRMRKSGVKPREAVWFIRNDAKLRQAEMNGEITFNRVYDDDYTVEPAWCDKDTEADIREMRRYYDEEINKINSGEWTAYGIIAKKTLDAACRLCRTPASQQHRSVFDSDNPTETSLWGIVVGNGPEDDRYLREVEIELALDLGVIDNVRVG